MRLGKPKISLEDFNDMLNFEQKENAPTPYKTSSALDSMPAQNAALGHGGILEMDFSQMESFPEHKFKLYEGQQLDDMVESIRQFGILLPIILWHTRDDSERA